MITNERIWELWRQANLFTSPVTFARLVEAEAVKECKEIIASAWRTIPANLPGVEGHMPLDEALKVAFGGIQGDHPCKAIDRAKEKP